LPGTVEVQEPWPSCRIWSGTRPSASSSAR
jgi:hypothetical protein